MSTDTVTVACKMPHGLVLRLFKMVPRVEAFVGGVNREVLSAEPLPETHTLKGYLSRYDPSLPPPAQNSRFALTPNVPKEFFEEWLRQNADLELVKNGLVFAHDDARNTRAEAKEKEKIPVGLEPLDPSSLPSNFKSVKTYDKDAI